VRTNRWGLALTAPSVILLTIILIIPLIYTFYLSLYDMRYLQQGNFLLWDNYITVLTDPDVIDSFGITFLVTITALIGSLLGGLLIALWINSRTGFIAYVIQISVLIPWVISMVVGTLLWKWMLNPLGLVTYLLAQVGITGVDLLGNAATAPYALIFVMIWRTTGFAMVLLLAGLKSIPKELEEAAKVDGAGVFQTFWRIRLPLLKTPLMIASIILMLSHFNNVDVPMVLTGGGPGNATNVLVMELYRQGFEYYNFGAASALSLILLVVNVILIALYLRMVKYEV